MYVLLGALWPYIDPQFTITRFEPPAKEALIGHGKCLDALANEDGRPIDIEFKTRSSQLLVDVVKYPRIFVEQLIVWEDDAPGAKLYCRRIIALRDVLKGLTPDERNKLLIFANSDDVLSEEPSGTRLLSRIDSLSPELRALSLGILDGWPDRWPSGEEWILAGLGTKAGRLNCYSKPNLYISATDRSPGSILEVGALRIRVRANGSCSLPLTSLSPADMPAIAALLRTSAAVQSGSRRGHDSFHLAGTPK